ncbi:MAG: hypothetical protein SOZ27_00955 [Spirochaetia bacterium]|nr:hypothetical protein [Spirochaetia bacterium]
MKYCRFLLPAFLALIPVAGCRDKNTQLIMPEKLFELPIGKTETDLAFFNSNRVSPLTETQIKMRDGLIYILDPGTNKLMEFNSYGEILTLWYHPDENPKPALLKEESDVDRDSQKEATKKAFPFRFHHLTGFAVNSQKQIYIADRLPRESALDSAEYGLSLNQNVVCFSKTGKAEYILGQEGISGNPFPYITDISVDRNDCLNITCYTKSDKVFFKYDSKGNLLSKTVISDKMIPAIQKDSVSRQAEILPTANPDHILIRTDIYGERTNSNNTVHYDFMKTVMWVYDLKQNAFQGYFNLPNTETKVADTASWAENSYPVMLTTDGFDHRGNLYFSSIEQQDIERVLILNQISRNIETRRIFTAFEKSIMIKRFVTPEGIILGIVFYPDKAEICWWRTDL